MRISRMRLVPAVIGVVGIVGLIGLAGCGRLADRSGTVQVPAATSPEAVALAAMGFDTGTAGLEPAGVPAPSSSAAAPSSPDHAGKRRPLRVELRKNVLHGETVVQTKNGVQTIEVQRGAVTAVTATTVTVKSTDGFTETWAFGPKFTVVHDKTKVATTDIKQGAQIGIAGTKSDAGSTARLAVLP